METHICPLGLGTGEKIQTEIINFQLTHNTQIMLTVNTISRIAFRFPNWFRVKFLQVIISDFCYFALFVSMFVPSLASLIRVSTFYHQIYWYLLWFLSINTLQWRHNGRDSVSNHQPHDCLLNRLFKRRWKKTSKLCVTGLCAGNLPGTGELLAQMASYAANVSIWWRHHVYGI